MAQEFTIKSENIEAKINQLLPSQGGFGAGVDFSASTMVIPVVDITETAEGSLLRQDLQSAVSLTGSTFTARNSTAVLSGIVPGFWRIYGTFAGFNEATSAKGSNLTITDGTTSTQFWSITLNNNSQIALTSQSIDTIVYVRPGESLNAISTTNQHYLSGYYRQIADASGNLINPPGFV